MTPVIHRHLSGAEAFQALSPEALDALAAVSSEAVLSAGEVMLREGDADTDLILILSGTAKAFRTAPDGDEIELNDIDAGDCIGELALFDSGRRAASVRATSESHILRIHVDRLDDDSVLTELKGTLATTVVRRARMLSDEMLKGMRAQLEARTLQNQFGYFLIFTIAIFIISTSLFYLVAEDYVEDVYDPGFSWQTVILFAIPSIFIIRVLKIPLRDLGIKRDGLFKSIWQAVLFCAVLTSPVIVYMLFFAEHTPPEERPVQITSAFLLQYFLHTVVQEIGARGLIQGLFVKFLADEKGHRSVLLASAIFASLHVTLGIDAVILTFFAGILFGYAYLYQKNLGGVIVIHYWFGVLAALLVAL
ncbi:cyclic nucleotide-binding domain-containing protein [Thalassococcus sp. S3]|uniref:cyclic nucleotide-binding domain-containing protein n=1 Tax=Thalassococcus sp. S3 TaxID=2017482 RepID=UPI0010241F78|nr:cyclic nucleotide-binding domain-containing protein [Thalassococcus sp. S3]QBF34011.1 hypothetical protein CFI11_22785 [Thalassococcus sp. S3]